MIEIMFSPIDIHEETTLEPKKKGDIDEHGSYFMNTSSNPCSHKKSLELIVLSNIATTRSLTPSYFLFIKTFKRVVVDAYVYHKYCKSRWHES
jgi:hypothetical protein